MGKIKKMPKLKKLPKIKVFEKIKMLPKTKISKKKLIIILAAATIMVAAVVLLVIFLIKVKNDSHRSIQIYGLEGTASIERGEEGYIDVDEDMYLESGDYIYVDDDSYVRLKLDDDKYVMVEENTVVSIIADGTKRNSETSIELEEGAITNEIQNTLNESSYYDVTTPNSIMEVTGTIFRVEVTIDEDGEVYTKVATVEGEVETCLIYPDGTTEEEIVPVEGGKEVTIYMDDEKTEYLSDPEELDYDAFPVPVLEFLRELMEDDPNLTDDMPEGMETLIEEMEEKLDEEDTELGEEWIEEDTEEEEKEELEDTEEEEEEEDEDEDQDQDDKDGDEDDEDDKNSTNGENKQEICTVTFTYNGTVFGTQKVKKGQKVTSLKLAPAENGSWDFDFSKPINGDTTISWKE